MKHFRFIALIALTIALQSCLSERILEDPPVTHQPLRILTAPSLLEVHDAPVPACEKIKDYVLVFVNTQSNTVEALQQVSLDEAAEYDQQSFPIEISEKGGTDRHAYKVYAFANFTPAMKAATMIDITKSLADLQVGDQLTQFHAASISQHTIDLSAFNGETPATMAATSKFVPMTAVVDYTATMQYHQPFDIPLVRMLAKLNFKIANNTCGEEPLRLQQISIRPIQHGAVYTLPHLKDESVGFYPERPAADAGQYGDGTSYVPVLPQTNADTTHVTLDLTAAPVVLPKDGTPVDAGTVYVNESLAKSHPTGHFTYDLYFIDSENGPHEYRYALSDDDFRSFLRNDDVTIPLTIKSPSSLEPEILFYPPIGGYPPVITDKNDDEFYATFSTPGDFAIYPHIYREGSLTDIRLTDTSAVTFDVNGTSLTSPDATGLEISGDNIFAKAPRYNANENCIKGTFSTATGHAILTIRVLMNDSHNYVMKKIHLIRE